MGNNPRGVNQYTKGSASGSKAATVYQNHVKVTTLSSGKTTFSVDKAAIAALRDKIRSNRANLTKPSTASSGLSGLQRAGQVLKNKSNSAVLGRMHGPNLGKRG